MVKDGYLLTKFKSIMSRCKFKILNNLVIFSILISVNISSSQQSSSLLKLPSLFSDNMVLQRNSEVHIWGHSAAKSEVEITVPWGKYVNTSNSNGEWEVIVPTQEQKDPFIMEICANENCITIQNVVLGEVWLASGQSNMSMPLQGWLPKDPIENSSAEILSSDQYPLRFFKTKQAVGHKPKTNVEGAWKTSDSINSPNFSATAYFFAKNLYKELKVPIGIINSSWGGTPVQSWADQNALQNIPAYKEALKSIENMDNKLVEYKNWLSPLVSFPDTTKDYIFDEWSKLDYNDSHLGLEKFDDTQWKDLIIPGNYADVFTNSDVNDFDGIVWIRKSFIIDQLGENYKLNLGLVDDMDFTYINGEFIGSTVGADSFKEKQYSIPNGLLKEGKNTIAIRLIDTMGDARIYSPLTITSNQGEISLEGNWKALPTAELFENNFYRLPPDYLNLNPRPNFVKLSAWTPTSLYNGMIHPLIPYTIKGAIWYQGESNVGFEDEYRIVFKNMINGWRSKWRHEFPFYFVQIAPFNYNNGLSPALRDAQRKVTTLANTGMVVTLDIGDPENIHPAKKNEVGKRLSNLALEKTYGFHDKHIASYPVSAKRENNKVIVTFDCNDGEGLKVKSLHENQIEISEDNIHFFNANAEAKGCTVELFSEKVKCPKYVRHGWSDTGTGAVLNSNGIPVSTFLIEIDY